MFLQETHTTPKVETRWKNECKEWEIIFSHGGSNSKGTATFIPKTMEYEMTETICDPHGRYVTTVISIQETTYCLINCYAPIKSKPKDQIKWLSEIQEILQKHEDCNIIIGGDLNDHFIPALDKFNCKPNAKITEYVKAWKTVYEELNLVDVWRILNPDKKSYTWRQGSSAARLKQSRLDYWLISTHLMYNLHNINIKPSTRSDHSLIDIDFSKPDKPNRGPSYWYFNASLLKDKDYTEKINTNIPIYKDKYKDIQDKGLLWDLIKMEIRSTTICF
jgi:exonuclease III